jgi:hypothetical protein
LSLEALLFFEKALPNPVFCTHAGHPVRPVVEQTAGIKRDRIPSPLLWCPTDSGGNKYQEYAELDIQ